MIRSRPHLLLAWTLCVRLLVEGVVRLAGESAAQRHSRILPVTGVL